MDEQPKHTPGPYEIGALPGTHDAALHSAATGELVAVVHSGASHGDAPRDQTALYNAALLKAAPRLRESLERVLTEDTMQARTPARQMARELLDEMNAGPDSRFLEERSEELRRYEEFLDAQVREMGMQSELRSEQGGDEFDEEEGAGHSFG